MHPAADTLFSLLREALGTSERESPGISSLPAALWPHLIDLSMDEGVAALAVDGYQKLTGDGRTSPLESPGMEDLKLDWLSGVLRTEDEYRRYVPKVQRLCRIYTENGFVPVLLKGIGLGLDYPVPEHRRTGDIDIYLCREDGAGGGETAREGDLSMREKMGITALRTRGGRHSHLMFEGVLVENHYELSDTCRGGERARRLEGVLRRLAGEGVKKRTGEKMGYVLPEADFNAIFLIWHLGVHFCMGLASLRQLCDILMFLKSHHDEIEWPMVSTVWKDAGMTEFAAAVGALLRKYLGMPLEWMPVGECARGMEDRVMEALLTDRGENRKSKIRNLIRYAREGWRYHLAFDRCWTGPLMESVGLHLVRRGDMVEKEVR